MAFLAGALLAIVGYKALSWGVVAIILLSIPFTLAIRTHYTGEYPVEGN